MASIGRTGRVTYRVKSSSEAEYVVELPAGGTAGQVKAQLAERIGVPAGGMILLFGGDQLEDGMNLEAAHVTTNIPLRLEFRQTTVQATVQAPSTVQLSVQLPSGRTVGITVPREANEEAIKRELQTKAQLNFQTISLSLNQEPLGRNVQAKDLQGETLQAVAQLRGGSYA